MRIATLSFTLVLLASISSFTNVLSKLEIYGYDFGYITLTGIFVHCRFEFGAVLAYNYESIMLKILSKVFSGISFYMLFTFPINYYACVML